MQLIALGSSVRLDNVGEPPAIIRQAIKQIVARIGPITAISRLYGTLAWPDPKQPNFVNAAIRADWPDLAPEALMQMLLDIELEFGRQRAQPNAPRTLDLDLVAVDDVLRQTSFLELPHPRLHQRVFVLEPLADVASEWVHPLRNQNVSQMLGRVRQDPQFDQGSIWVLDESSTG